VNQRIALLSLVHTLPQTLKDGLFSNLSIRCPLGLDTLNKRIEVELANPSFLQRGLLAVVEEERRGSMEA
jgi:hypothetical protein